MHIVWIKTELLHPVDKGGRIRTYEMLRALKSEHEITYVCLDDGTAAPDALQRAAEYSTRVVRVPVSHAAKGTVRFYADLARALFSPLPYAIEKYRSAALRSAIETVVRERRADVVVCDFLAPSLNVPNDLSCPTVLFQHNVESAIWDRHAQVASGLRKPYFALQAKRMRAFEPRECRRYDRVVAVSAPDADAFRSRFGVRQVDEIPTGVDTSYFTEAGEPADPAEMVFTGSMDWLPNEDACTWFCDEILPRIRAAVPGAHLAIVGRSPNARVLALAAREGVVVTGSVPDVRPHMARAALFVVPIRIGGGTRLKIYEAMATGRPVVSTTVGAEGLPLTPGEHLAIADDAEQFAATCVAMLRDRPAAAAMAARGARIVRERFGWNAVAREFARACAAAVAQSPARGPIAAGTTTPPEYSPVSPIA